MLSVLLFLPCPDFMRRSTTSRSLSALTYYLEPRHTMRFGWTRKWLQEKQSRTSNLSTASSIFPERYARPRTRFKLLIILPQFKIAVAVPPTNDVDIFANDLGFIAIVDERGELAGFNVTVGGGMGVTHGNKKTYPRLADVMCFCTVEQGAIVAEKVMLTQRDNGNRAE